VVAPHRGRHAEQADLEREAATLRVLRGLGDGALHRPPAALVPVDAPELGADGGPGGTAQPHAALGLLGPLRQAGHVGDDAIHQLRRGGDVDGTVRGRLCHGASFAVWLLTLSARAAGDRVVVAGSHAWPSSITWCAWWTTSAHARGSSPKPASSRGARRPVAPCRFRWRTAAWSCAPLPGAGGCCADGDGTRDRNTNREPSSRCCGWTTSKRPSQPCGPPGSPCTTRWTVSDRHPAENGAAGARRTAMIPMSRC